MKKLALFTLVVLSFSNAFGMVEKSKQNCEKIATAKQKETVVGGESSAEKPKKTEKKSVTVD